MKAVIKKVKFHKEYESKFGTMFTHLVEYDDKKAFYTSKKKEQTAFEEGKEAEFTEETKYYTHKQTGEQVPYLVIKPFMQQRQSGFGKALAKEQSRYSGFAVSYSKDLVMAGKLPIEDLAPHAWTLFELMVAMDKSIQS